MNIDEAYDLLEKEDKKINTVMNISGWLTTVYGIGLLISSIIFGFSALLFGFLCLVFGIAVVYRNHRLNEFAWENLDTLIILVILSILIGAIITGILIIYVYVLRRKTIILSSRIESGEFQEE